MVEDSESDALLALRELRRRGFEPTHARVDTAAAMRAALESRPWDVILIDYVMLHFSGLGALDVAGQSGLDLPLIIVSGAIDEEVATKVMEHGAHDHVRKNDLRRLGEVIRQQMSEAARRRDSQIRINL